MNKLLQSFGYAWAGIKYCLQSERNMRIHALAVLVVVSAGVICRLTRTEWLIILLTINIVIVTEMVNTAIEKTIDLYTLKLNPLAAIAKNAAAGAVLTAAGSAIIVAILVFGPYILAYLEK